MARKKRQVRDLRRSAKDHPRYREWIDRDGWVPHILCDTDGAYWNGTTAMDGSGKLLDGISDAARKELRNMMLDGCFGADVKAVWIDPDRYDRIRDDLITWPNAEAVARAELRVMSVTREA